MAKSRIVWSEVTRNCHVGRLDDVPVLEPEASRTGGHCQDVLQGATAAHPGGVRRVAHTGR